MSLLFYMLLIAPADAFFTSFFSASAANGAVQYLVCGLISAVIIILLLEVAKAARMLALLLVPYLFFILFGGLVYFWDHHIGIFSMFYVFVLWCFWDQLQLRRETLFTNNKPFRYLGLFVLALALLSTLRWSVVAARNDIDLNYGTGREAAAFIMENKLDQLNIWVAWRIIENEKAGEKYYDYASTEGVPTIAYFDNNIFSNFNYQNNNRRYLTHKINCEDKCVNELDAKDNPDVLFTNLSLYYTLGEQISVNDYALVKSISGRKIWKDEVDEYKVLIFLNKDLLNNYPQLDILNWEDELLPNEEISPWFTK